jgi:hypothetical protein
MLERAARVAVEGPSEPSAREAAALDGDWYRRRVGADYTDAECQELLLEINLALAGDDHEWPDNELAAFARQVAERLLRENGFATTPASIERVSAVVERAEKSFRELLRRRAHGDWSEDANLAKFPRLPDKSSGAVPTAPFPGCTFDTLLAGWALDHGFQLDTKPIPRALL